MNETEKLIEEAERGNRAIQARDHLRLFEAAARERLISDAATAIHASIVSASLAESIEIVVSTDGIEFEKALARAALAVFEKAHAPTDDERVRVLTDMLRFRLLADPVREYLELYREAVRSEVPEPGAEVMHRGPFGHVWPCPLFYVGNWNRVDNGHKPVRECTNTAVCGSAEPQGEPSDAQVLESFLGKLAGDGAYTLDFTSAEALHGHIVSLLKRDIAALRAAGGAR